MEDWSKYPRETIVFNKTDHSEFLKKVKAEKRHKSRALTMLAKMWTDGIIQLPQEK